MKSTKLRRVYSETEQVNNYRELLARIKKNFPNNIAFKYKKDCEKKQPEYVEKTYNQFINDIKALSTSLLELGYEGKKIAVIGNNRYEWCTTYLAVTTGNMIIVPLDKALPDNEIETLLERSKAEVVIFDKKYVEIMKKVKKNISNKVNTLICMDDFEDEEINRYSDLLTNGYDLIEKGSSKYDEIKIDKDKMSILLFTSGTTALPKAVMLSQQNVCANVSSMATWVKVYESDVLLSFLPIHHTFECGITFLYGIYCGATIAFCDGLKYIQKNMVEYKVSILVAVPLLLETMYKKILKGIEDKGKTKLIKNVTKVSNLLLKLHIDIRRKLFKEILNNFGGNLREVFYGAAPMNKETIVGFNNFGIDLIQGYGLTETSPIISAETDKEKRAGSVGLIFDNLDVKIENKDKDGIGEIVVKGPSVMLRILRKQRRNRKSIKRWLVLYR